jgi:hypothetical protein
MIMEQIPRAGARVCTDRIILYNYVFIIIFNNLICSLSNRFIQNYAAKSSYSICYLNLSASIPTLEHSSK